MNAKKMAISDFKANALRVIDEVSKTHQPVVITRRGKPLAQLSPYRKLDNRPVPDELSEAFVSEEDLVTPLGDAMWEACQ